MMLKNLFNNVFGEIVEEGSEDTVLNTESVQDVNLEPEPHQEEVQQHPQSEEVQPQPQQDKEEKEEGVNQN